MAHIRQCIGDNNKKRPTGLGLFLFAAKLIAAGAGTAAFFTIRALLSGVRAVDREALSVLRIIYKVNGRALQIFH